MDLTHFATLVGTLQSVAKVWSVKRVRWCRGPKLTNSFSPPALVAVPCGYFGEGCGSVKESEARATLNPQAQEATHFTALVSYLWSCGEGCGVCEGRVRRFDP